jgi:hypothetical protein
LFAAGGRAEAKPLCLRGSIPPAYKTALVCIDALG